MPIIHALEKAEIVPAFFPNKSEGLEPFAILNLEFEDQPQGPELMLTPQSAVHMAHVCLVTLGALIESSNAAAIGSEAFSETPEQLDKLQAMIDELRSQLPAPKEDSEQG